jgi:hypothetical protein
MAGREDIAGILASRWDQMPDPSLVEDRRPTDPLDAYVRPLPLNLPPTLPLGKLSPDELDTLLNTLATGEPMRPISPMTTPGIAPMAQDTVRDIGRFAANEAKAPPVPARAEFPGVTEQLRTPFEKRLLADQAGDSFRRGVTTGRGHLDYQWMPAPGAPGQNLPYRSRRPKDEFR